MESSPDNASINLPTTTTAPSPSGVQNIILPKFVAFKADNSFPSVIIRYEEKLQKFETNSLQEIYEIKMSQTGNTIRF